MITESQGESALDDFVRDIGAPYHLKFDNSHMQTGRAWMSILRKYNIASSTTEPHNPQQNYAERKI